jgi:hypothetical protein
MDHLETPVKMHNGIVYKNPLDGNRDVGCEQTHLMKLSAAFPNFPNAPKFPLTAHTLIIQRALLTYPITTHCLGR